MLASVGGEQMADAGAQYFGTAWWARVAADLGGCCSGWLAEGGGESAEEDEPRTAQAPPHLTLDEVEVRGEPSPYRHERARLGGVGRRRSSDQADARTLQSVSSPLTD